MFRRMFLGLAAAAIVGACLVPRSPDAEASRNTMNVQVRVYRLTRPGVYNFLPNVTVQLNDGRVGVTSADHGQRGCAFFRNLPRRSYTAKALVNGRWYSATSTDIYGTSLRINVQIP